MASDLTVAVLTGGTVFHVHGFDDGVAAEFTFHIQQRTLDIMLSIFFAGGIGSIRLGPVITEQVELFIAFAGGQLLQVATSSAMTVNRLTSKRESTMRSYNIVIASRIRADDEVKSPKPIDPTALLGTLRPNRSMVTGP